MTVYSKCGCTARSRRAGGRGKRVSEDGDDAACCVLEAACHQCRLGVGAYGMVWTGRWQVTVEYRTEHWHGRSSRSAGTACVRARMFACA